MKYLGPSHFFVWNDKTYERGADIPITKEAARHHVLQGHRFEGMDPAVGPTGIVAPDPARAPDVPRTDSGDVDPDMKVIRAKDAPEAASTTTAGQTANEAAASASKA